MTTVNPKAHAVAVAAYASWHNEHDVSALRKGFDRMLPEPAPDVLCTEAVVGGVPGRWIQTPQTDDSVVLYLHGGGGLIGSSFAYRDMCSRIARSACARVFVADYALGPEHPFPAGFNDARAAYAALLNDFGVSPAHLAVVGDSAGAGIGVAMVASFKDEGVPLPSCVVAMSPAADFTFSGSSMLTNAETDPLVSREGALASAGAYLVNQDPRDPRVSAVFADFTDFPPLLLQVADCEALLSDSERIAGAVRAAGGSVDLQVGQGLVHVYQMWADQLPEADAALDAVGAFIRLHTREQGR